jgi:transcriptional regulator with XRE-family HTH domain
MSELGDYLRQLRTEKRLSFRDVEQLSGVSAAYILQIEQGKRKAPGGNILKKLAEVYQVPARDVLRAAGYMDDISPGLSEEEEVEMAFAYVMNDRRYSSGTRLKGKLDTEVKRFVVEMYEKATGKKLLP